MRARAARAAASPTAGPGPSRTGRAAGVPARGSLQSRRRRKRQEGRQGGAAGQDLTDCGSIPAREVPLFRRLLRRPSRRPYGAPRRRWYLQRRGCPLHVERARRHIVTRSGPWRPRPTPRPPCVLSCASTRRPCTGRRGCHTPAGPNIRTAASPRSGWPPPNRFSRSAHNGIAGERPAAAPRPRPMTLGHVAPGRPFGMHPGAISGIRRPAPAAATASGAGPTPKGSKIMKYSSMHNISNIFK